MNTKQIAVIGAGSWGTALAILLSTKGHKITLWDIDTAHLQALQQDRENRPYLPGIPFPPKLQIAQTLQETLTQADLALFSAPAQHFRNALQKAAPYIPPKTPILNVAKGIEQKTLLRMSEIAAEVLPQAPYAILSGPSHAEEVGRQLPTTVAVASKDIQLAQWVQDIFITPRFRVYTTEDVVGVELGGALKNIIALGAGISDGMGFGDNAKAALMTRGLMEITRLGEAQGADPQTFAGLTGVGDLIVTCTSMHSRNRRCGILIGEGMPPTQATKEVGMVVEGMFTASAAYELANKLGVEMPITQQIYWVVNGETTAEEAAKTLMGRERKHEKA